MMMETAGGIDEAIALFATKGVSMPLVSFYWHDIDMGNQEQGTRDSGTRQARPHANPPRSRFDQAWLDTLGHQLFSNLGSSKLLVARRIGGITAQKRLQVPFCLLC